MQIPLTKGRFTRVDPELFEQISSFKWRLDGQGYARRTSREKNGKRKEIRLHRHLMDAEKDKFVDHINGDKLDNRLCNLRTVTKSQNTFNKSKHADSYSKYKGVTWRERDKQWVAKIGFEHTIKYLGMFESEEKAAIAYNNAAIVLFGEYARLNQLEVGI